MQRQPPTLTLFRRNVVRFEYLEGYSSLATALRQCQSDNTSPYDKDRIRCIEGRAFDALSHGHLVDDRSTLMNNSGM
jgi:hypothetical protein